MSSTESSPPPATGVDSAKRQAVTLMTTEVSSDHTRSLLPPPPPAEIEIPLELVELPPRLDDPRLPAPRPRRRLATLTSTTMIDQPLSPLDEEELITSSSSSSSSPDNHHDDDWTTATTCSTADHPHHPSDRTLADCRHRLVAGSDEPPVDDPSTSLCVADVEALSLSRAAVSAAAAVTTTSECTMMIDSRAAAHHSASAGLTARLGNLLNSAVMKAQKQLARGQHQQLQPNHRYLRQGGYVFTTVCLLAGLLKNHL